MDFTVHWLPRIRLCCDTHFVRCINTSFTFICQVVLRALIIYIYILWYNFFYFNKFSLYSILIDWYILILTCDKPIFTLSFTLFQNFLFSCIKKKKLATLIVKSFCEKCILCCHNSYLHYDYVYRCFCNKSVSIYICIIKRW